MKNELISQVKEDCDADERGKHGQNQTANGYLIMTGKSAYRFALSASYCLHCFHNRVTSHREDTKHPKKDNDEGAAIKLTVLAANIRMFVRGLRIFYARWARKAGV